MANTNWKIEIEWSENEALGAVAETGITWDNFAAFTSLLTAVTHTAPKCGAYNKTTIKITHLPSDECYELRLDITHPDSDYTGDNDLLQHVKDVCLRYLQGGYKLGTKPEDQMAARASWAKWAERFLDAK